MIRVEIRGENIEVTDAIRSFIEDKVNKLDRYFNDQQDVFAHANIKTYHNKMGKVEITVPMKGLTLRAEERHDDLYTAVDAVVEKLERQIRKHKTKINRKFREKDASHVDLFQVLSEQPEESKDDDDIKIVKSKEFTLKPMDAEEAILQMDMLGHDFFVFNDRYREATSIVYKRKDGKYGLIETN
ncbi:ribosome hibernation-promoting factor, HPF/YfiA family [Nosocomiicoccus massiliensis]|uniref:Ribosome hibernation promoting factor n=1 Tax=Nosocomiicoccus massiliensis TaxID=1232430 RepID=A0AAF0YHY0_9STAP|nr:ribosome-associated translation inhibitor RaiA [Nosocomiicoccus massiliensis]WOS95973.1 ribosome-associated translation inhibitor RaiA [Nosocomiicoccus massiliensis]